MLKKHLKKTLISCLFTLSPIVFGLIFWNKLPNTMTTHWGVDSIADGNSGKIFAVFGMPIILAAVNFFCVAITSLDKKNKNQSPKAFNIIFFIIPIISVFSSAAIYSAALGKIWDFSAVLPILIGLAFLVIGNILPKLRQNYTFGIKMKWTFESEANWLATHRFGGKLWVVTGLLIMLTAFLPFNIMFIAFMLLIFSSLIAITVYSYLFHKKEVKNGVEFNNEYKTKGYKTVTVILIPIILIVIAIVMFTGNVTIEYNDTSFTVDSIYYDELTVAYTEISSIELYESTKAAQKELGFGNAIVCLGIFKNDEFDSHTRYTYNKCKSVVVIKGDEKTLLINGKTDAATTEIYNKLLTETGE